MKNNTFFLIFTLLASLIIPINARLTPAEVAQLRTRVEAARLAAGQAAEQERMTPEQLEENETRARLDARQRELRSQDTTAEQANRARIAAQRDEERARLGLPPVRRTLLFED